tara:strand:+ start:2416 stop:2550 length:135 start_codon:yes stop_codon:yes gene_type:complete
MKYNLGDYENPFASFTEEIGQEDVPVDDEMILREMVRRIILQLL